MYLSELMEKQPIVPCIRQSNFAVRSPRSTAERRLPDYLIVYVRPLEEIAGYCGFADIHHFSKSFKRKTGISPGMYRSAKRPHP